MIEPYQYASGDAHGDEPEKAVPTYGSSPETRWRSLTERARLAAHRRRDDPLWKERSSESRARLLALDRREENR